MHYTGIYWSTIFGDFDSRQRVVIRYKPPSGKRFDHGRRAGIYRTFHGLLMRQSPNSKQINQRESHRESALRRLSLGRTEWKRRLGSTHRGCEDGLSPVQNLDSRWNRKLPSIMEALMGFERGTRLNESPKDWPVERPKWDKK